MEENRLVVSFGADGAELQTALDSLAGATKQQMEEMQREATNATKALTHEFTRQAQTFGMTSREAAIMRLALDGVAESELAAARAASQQLDALEQQQQQAAETAAALKQAEQQQAAETAAARKYAEQMTRELKTQAATLGMSADAADLYRAELVGLTEAERQQIAALQKEITAARQNNEMMERGKAVAKEFATSEEKLAERVKELSRLLDRGAIDAATYGRAMASAQAMAGNGWDRIADQLDAPAKGFARMGQAALGVGTQLSFGVTLPLTVMGATAVNEFAKFDNAMTQAVAKMSNMTPQLRAELEGVATAQSQISRFSPDQLAQGLEGLAASGMNAQQSMASLSVVDAFATAGAFDLGKATQLLLDSQAALGMVEKDAVKNKQALLQVSDALIKAADQSTADAQQFAEALANGGADAKLFNMSLTETMAVLDAYATKGNKGAAAGSDLARATRLISKANRDNAESFQKYGIDVVDEVTGKYRSLIDIVADMEVAFKDMQGPQVGAALEELGFEALAQSAILPLIGMSDAMRQWKKEQEDATNYTANIAEQQMMSFSNQMLAFANNAKVAAIEIGATLAPAIKAVNVAMKYGIDTWRELPGWMKAGAIGAGAVAAAVGPMLVAFGTTVIVGNQAIAMLGAFGVTVSAAAIKTAALSAAQLGLNASLLAAGPLVGVVAGYYLAQLHPAMVAYNAAAAESIRLEDELGKAQAARASKGVKTALAEEDPAARRKALQDGLAAAQKNVSGYVAHVASAKKAHEAFANTWRGWAGWKMVEVAAQEVDEMTKGLERSRAEAAAYQAELDKMGEETAKSAGEAGEAAKKESDEVKSLIEQLRLEAATFGMSTAQERRYRLEKEGATAATLAEADALAASIDAKEKAKAAEDNNKKYDDQVKAMQAEAATFGLSSRAAAIYRMEKEGATAATLEAARAADAQLTALEREKTVKEKLASFQDNVIAMQAEAAAYGQGSRAVEIYKLSLMGASEEQLNAARAADAQLTALEKEKKLKDRAAEITKKHRPAAQQQREDQDEYKRMLDAGLISLDVYTEAMRDLQKETKQDFTVSLGVKGVESVEAGSADALARLNEYAAVASAVSASPMQLPIPRQSKNEIASQNKKQTAKEKQQAGMDSLSTALDTLGVTSAVTSMLGGLGESLGIGGGGATPSSFYGSLDAMTGDPSQLAMYDTSKYGGLGMGGGFPSVATVGPDLLASLLSSTPLGPVGPVMGDVSTSGGSIGNSDGGSAEYLRIIARNTTPPTDGVRLIAATLKGSP